MEQKFIEKAEKEAGEKAIKQIASMLSRPDQLDKVEQYRRRIARKKASVEARLKAAVQSQLDGVKTGLNQMNQALHDVKEIKESMGDVNRMYTSVGELSVKMRDIKDITSQHSQLATAMENLKHIFEVPEEVEKAREMIKDGKLLLAHKVLTDLENSRDDLLYEQHKLDHHSEGDIRQLQTYFAEAEKLSTELGAQLWRILAKTITTIRKDPTTVTTALRIIEREERTDMKLQQAEEGNGFLPPGRPKRWRAKALDILKEAVEARVESDICETRENDKMWLVRHLEIIKKTVLEDLQVARYVSGYSFPPSYNIFQKYANWYHEALSLHLQNLIDTGLEGNEIISLLRWLNEYTGVNMMGTPLLKPLDVTKLPPLLDDDTNKQLIASYFATTKSNLREWKSKSLSTDVSDWSSEDEPEQDADGFNHTSLPVIFFKMIHEVIEVAKTISTDLTKRVVETCVDEMNSFVRSYANAMTTYKEEHFANRQQPTHYYLYMVAIINNCESFISFATKFEVDMQYIMRDDDVSATNENQQEDITVPFLLGFKQDMSRFGETGCDYLLDELFLDMKTHFSTLMQKDQLENSEQIQTFIATVEDYYNDYVHLRANYLQYILFEAERRVIVEYLRAILDRRIKCNNDDERSMLADRLLKDHDVLTIFFNRFGAANSTRENCDVLKPIAEVIKLQDKSMMTLELSGLVSNYNDVTVEQMQALLALRGDFSTSEAKELTESLNEMNPNSTRTSTTDDDDLRGPKEGPSPLFKAAATTQQNRRSGFFLSRN